MEHHRPHRRPAGRVGVDVRRDPALAPARPPVLRRRGARPPGRPAAAALGAATPARAVVGPLGRAGRAQPRAVLRSALPRGLPPAERARPRRSPRCRRWSSWGWPTSSSASARPRVTLVAAVVGVAGVVTLVWQNDRAGTVDAVGVAAAVGAVVSSALGFALVKRWSPPDDVLVTTSWQLVAGGLLLLPVAAVVEGAPPALDGSGARRPALPRPRRVGARLRAVVPRADPHGCRCRRRRRAGQPGGRHGPRGAAARGAVRPGAPRLRSS